jgi:putative peptidoglycan lipid II flippase
MLMAFGVGAARILSAAHNARREFLCPAAAEVAFQLGSIAYLVAFHEQGTIGLVGGMVLGGFLQLLVSAGGLLRDRVRIPARLELNHPAVRRMVRLSLPAYIGTAGSKINLLVNAVFASTLSAGSLSALQYAYMMVDILAATVGASLARALSPFLSQQFTEGRHEEVMRSVDRALVGTAFVTMPAAAGLWLLARPIVVLLLQRGSFDARSTELTTSALSIYAPLLLGLGLNYVLATVYYSKKDTMTPMKLGLARVAMTTSLCALLVPRLGHVGIALAATVGEFAKLGLMMGYLRGKEERAAVCLALGSCARAGAAVLAMGVLVYPLGLIGQSLGLSRGLLGAAFLGMTVLVGATVYVVALRFAAPSDFYYFVGHLRRVRQDDEVARSAS